MFAIQSIQSTRSAVRSFVHATASAACLLALAPIASSTAHPPLPPPAYVYGDTTPPVLTCPPSATVGIEDLRDPPSTGVPVVLDDTDPMPEVTFNDNRSGLTGCNATGVIVRTWRAEDSAGNVATCEQSVFVLDTTAPVFVGCPTDQTLSAGPGCTATATWTDPVAHDVGFFEGFEDPAWRAGNYRTQPSTNWNEYSSQLQRVASGTAGIASKSGGFHAVADSTMIPPSPFAYTGLFNRLGGFSPVFGTGFTTSVAVYVDLADPAVVANTYGWDVANAVSNQSNAHQRVFVFHTASDALGNVLVGGSNGTNFTRQTNLHLGDHYVISTSGWYVFETDFRNAAGVLAVDLNLRDALGTLLWTKTLSSPSDLIATAVGGNRYMWFTFLEVDTLAIDDTELVRNAVVTCSHTSGSTFPIGTTQVTCTATDACGNMETCTFDVIVEDVTSPVITTCAPDQTIPADASCVAYVPDLTGSVTASDTCGSVVVTQSPLAGTAVGTGPVVVTLTATDGAGNFSTCTSSVLVTSPDTDGDGVADCDDGCPLDPLKTSPGICGCGVSDVDTDRDGTPDCNDGCPLDSFKTAPGPCGCGVADTDTDGDGTADCNDGCPLDPLKTSPGQCGCGVADTDIDGDGTAGCNDGCPLDPSKTSPGQCGCGVVDVDTDGDGVADCIDNCPLMSNPGQLDQDSDLVGDACDNCVQVANPGQGDCNGDLIGDACEIFFGVRDCNGNGIPDRCDIADLTSGDLNNNSIPDECEVNGGTPFCFGYAVCPCGNNSVAGSGQGCVNSTGLGAALTGSGVSSIGADSLELTVTNLPGTGSALFIQGDAQTNLPFQDGRRCVSGAQVRLGIKAPTGGTAGFSASFPEMGDLPISIGGSIGGPGVRYYQVWYRNVLGPCGTRSNLSNGLAVIWTP